MNISFAISPEFLATARLFFRVYDDLEDSQIELMLQVSINNLYSLYLNETTNPEIPLIDVEGTDTFDESVISPNVEIAILNLGLDLYDIRGTLQIKTVIELPRRIQVVLGDEYRFDTCTFDWTWD